MAKTTRPIPRDMPLADTLASRVRQIREFRNMSQLELANESRIGLERLHDIESGMETWLSSPDRQVLAKALSVEPVMLLEVEYRPDHRAHPEFSSLSDELRQEMAEAILAGARELECPQCGSLLRCSIQQGFDIKEQPIYFPRAFCQKCPFVLK